MQNIGFVGKIYNMKTETDKKGNVSRVNLRLAVRKKFVTEEEKKANKYNVFVPIVAFGKTAELLDEHFEDGRIIGFSNCEYSTFEYQKDGDTVYGHNFKAGSLEFLPKDADGEESAPSKSRKRSKRRDDEDEEEEEAPRRKKRATKEAPKKKRRPEPEEEEDDDDYEDDFEDEDDDDVPF